MDGPVRTIVPAAVSLGIAQVGEQRCMLLRVPDDETGGTIDLIMSKAMCGELIAHADSIRLRALEHDSTS
jgi:hypothetical protein